jgi:sugar lactone lactonase YvrE
MSVAALEVELALDAKADLGEGPVWDAANQALIWVDIMRGRVHTFQPEGHRCRNVAVGQPVGAVALRSTGGLVLAVRDGFGRLDPGSERLQMLAPVRAADRGELRMNDGKCDAAGRFWAGTMNLDVRPGEGALYRLDPDGRVHVMLREVTISNGLDWSLDGRRMYYVDSPTQRIDVFDFDVEAGLLSNRRPLVNVPAEKGLPDGLTVDAEGFLWLALWGGGALHRYSPEGVLDLELPLPVTHPTSCTFGGPDLRDLYITTARTALSAAERARQPQAGGVFRCRPAVGGRPANSYRG